MLLRPFRPHRTRRVIGNCVYLLWTLTFISLVHDLHAINIGIRSSNRSVPSRSQQLPERIFIASIHWNNGPLLRSHWNATLLNLVQYLGPENVYISIVESGSWDDTKNALRELDGELGKLGAQRIILLSNLTHQDLVDRTPAEGETGWVYTKRGRTEIRRIPFLAGGRNRVMDSMKVAGGKAFGKVLWLNDVIFTTEDVLRLLDTHNGEYNAVCSLDFAHPPGYYDTFALRDVEGSGTVTSTWPYFLAGESRRAMIAN
ncbi:hypothetical protein GLAREA_12055 [Glarea lozoyensis ATCC 20868]|uniref:Uncharacterized protein n=1 Tax=Glarea lozoyensis (strain ATCC 20868 / MF5171) TaxID=1116229 RepID=S3E0A2_GLAL2|nr:uncharacterized protein GLAREA_12055 [Glarea lozoyensis ATCC 20868]EPE31973.1 hypothetical protein GLAREA_12055 [Glarea lozoyensis ATCC 20868]